MEIHGLEGVCGAEVGKGRRNGIVMWESALDGLDVWRKWQCLLNASHRNGEGH